MCLETSLSEPPSDPANWGLRGWRFAVVTCVMIGLVLWFWYSVYRWIMG